MPFSNVCGIQIISVKINRENQSAVVVKRSQSQHTLIQVEWPAYTQVRIPLGACLYCTVNRPSIFILLDCDIILVEVPENQLFGNNKLYKRKVMTKPDPYPSKRRPELGMHQTTPTYRYIHVSHLFFTHKTLSYKTQNSGLNIYLFEQKIS